PCRLAPDEGGEQFPGVRVIKKIPLVLLGLLLCAAQRLPVITGGTVAEAVPLPRQLANLINGPRLRLNDGRTLHDVKIAAVDADAITMRTKEGDQIVPYSLFPDEMQPTLAQYRPAKQNKVTVTGPGVVKYSESATVNATAPLTTPRIQYPGRVSITGADGKVIPLVGVIVLAVRPSDYASFNQTRLDKHGAEIDAAQAKAIAAITAGQRDAALRPAALAARDDWLLSIYTSFDPLPKAVAMTDTGPNGAFNLVCDEPQIVLVARGTRPVGDGFAYYTWAAGAAGSGGKAELNEESLLRR
ncbi:MAG: hypothetical protein WCL04_04930, partial [Verrucomicrobiota bacterium]